MLHRPTYQYLGNIILYSGPVRSGKSLLALFHALIAIEDFELERLVCNFELDIKGLLQCCRNWRLPHTYKIISAGQVYLFREPSDLLGFTDALIILDECGIYLNVRDWANNKRFFKYIPQIGKGSINCHLFLLTQFPDQIDIQAQQLIEFHWTISSKKVFDRGLKMPRLIHLFARLMPAESLGERNSRKTARQKIRERFVLTKKRISWKMEYLQPLFSAYSSGGLVEGAPLSGYFKKTTQKDVEIWQSDFCRFERPDWWRPFPCRFQLSSLLYVFLLRFNVVKPQLLSSRLSKVFWTEKEWQLVTFFVPFALVILGLMKLLSAILFRLVAP